MFKGTLEDRKEKVFAFPKIMIMPRPDNGNPMRYFLMFSEDRGVLLLDHLRSFSPGLMEDIPKRSWLTMKEVDHPVTITFQNTE